MKTFDAAVILPRERIMVEGAYRDLHPGDTIGVKMANGTVLTCVVETRVLGGAVVHI